MHEVWKSLAGDYYWRVTVKCSNPREMPALKYGYAKTEEQAVRNARNFIRHNQNTVYG